MHQPPWSFGFDSQTSKTVYVLEFKRTSDQRRDYRERGESRALAQHDVLIRSLEKVAGEMEREGERSKVKLIVFVEGACGSVHEQTFNNNLKEVGVVESKRGAMRKGLVMNYSMHRIRSYAPILHKGRVQQMGAEVYGTR